MEIQFPDPAPEFMNMLNKKGYNAYYMALYSTKNILARLMQDILNIYLHEDCAADLVNFDQRLHVLRPKTQYHFINGKPTLVADDGPRPLEGTYLRIMCPIRGTVEHIEENGAGNIPADVERFAAMMSLVHGDFVAAERHYSVLCTRKSTSAFSEPVSIRQTAENENLSIALANLFDEIYDCKFKFNHSIAYLLVKSHQETFDTTKFLFLWTAIEVLLGKGADRRRFAVDEMKSEKLNDTINYLRKIRDKIVHEGVFIFLDQKTLLKARCVIILSLSENHNLKQRVIEYIELLD